MEPDFDLFGWNHDRERIGGDVTPVDGDEGHAVCGPRRISDPPDGDRRPVGPADGRGPEPGGVYHDQDPTTVEGSVQDRPVSEGVDLDGRHLGLSVEGDAPSRHRRRPGGFRPEDQYRIPRRDRSWRVERRRNGNVETSPNRWSTGFEREPIRHVTS